MRKTFTDFNGNHHAGDVIEISEARAKGLIKQGLVIQDKSLDGAKETKGHGC